jgi:hypothetical protein
MIVLGFHIFEKFSNSGLPHLNFYFFSYVNFDYTLKVFSKIFVSSSVVVPSLKTFWDKEKSPSICKWMG